MTPSELSVRKVRTFADDIKRARGETPESAIMPAPTLATAISQYTPPAQTLTPSIENMLAPTIKPSEDGAELFDIRSATAGGETATIVSEQSGEKWSLTTELLKAFRGWLGKTRETYESGAQSIPHVAPAAGREHIVRAAIVNNKRAPQDDHSALVEKLRAYTTKPAEDLSLTLKNTDTEVAAWSHVDQDGSVAVLNPHAALAIPDPVIKKTPPIERIPMSLPIPPAAVYDTTPEQPVRIPIRTESIATPAPVSVVLPELTVEAPDVAIPVPPAAKTIPQKEAALKTEVADVDVLQEKTFTERARERAYAKREFETGEGVAPVVTSHLALYAGAIILVFIIVVGIGGVGYFSLSQNATEEAPQQKASVLLSGITKREAVPLALDRTSFLIDLTKRTREAAGALGDTHEFYFVPQNDTTDRALPPEVFFERLEAHTPPALIRTITSMVFGARISSLNTPFAVFRIRDRNEALGGMLAWEKYMNSDLAPLFGEDQLRIGATPQKFTDVSLAGNDARVLKDQNGTTVMVYTIVGNLLILSTSEATIKELIPSM